MLFMELQQQLKVSTPATLDGYTPVNQKVRQYPYMYLGFNPLKDLVKFLDMKISQVELHLLNY